MTRDECNCCFSFWQFFALSPPKTPKNEHFKKMNKMPGDIIILHKCTKNHDYLLYCSWDMGRDRCNCSFSFWAIFCPFTPLTAQKMNIPKKFKKKHLEISSFYTIVPKIMMTGYTVPEIWRTRCNYFPFWTIFCLFTPPNSPKNDHFKKNKKNPLEISSLYTIVLKFTIIGCIVPEIWRVTDVIANFHFGLLLHFYPAPPSLTAQKNKIKKN